MFDRAVGFTLYTVSVDNQDFLCYNIYILNNKGEPFMTVNTMNDTVNHIRTMNQEELVHIMEEVALRRSYVSRSQLRTIAIGDTVEFTQRNGTVVQGTVRKKAIKNVTVETTIGNWKVPAHMLTVV